jgi:hypothetical protein
MSKISIIGAGWFGLHIGKFLKDQGNEVTIFEKSNKLFSASSGKNQYRLHLGFHYSRNYSTRIKNFNNYYRFLNEYPTLAEPIKENYYCVIDEDSLLDFKTYKSIFEFDQIPFRETDTPQTYNLRKIEGCILCDEMALNTNSIREFFLNYFSKDEIRFNTEVILLENQEDGVLVNGEKYDYCINCTYNHFNPIEGIDVNYEACLTLVYNLLNSKLSNSSLTLVDGEFFSIYPIVDEEKCFTLTHVKYTPMKVFTSAKECESYIEKLESSDIEDNKKLIEESVNKYYPNFNNDFVYKRFFTSIKTKTLSNSANRDLHVSIDNRIMNTFSGKILEIFELEKYVNKWIGNA